MNINNQNFLRMRFCILFLVNLLIFAYNLFCISPNVSCESYTEYSRYLHITKEKFDSSNDGHNDGPKNLSAVKLAAEIAGGCAVNLASFLICVAVLEAEGDDPELPGLIMSTGLAPLASSIGVTGLGYLVRDEGSLAGAFIGASIPVLAGIFIASQMKPNFDNTLSSIFIGSQCSPIGAVIGYKLGSPLAKYKWLDHILAFSLIAYLLGILAVLP